MFDMIDINSKNFISLDSEIFKGIYGCGRGSQEELTDADLPYPLNKTWNSILYRLEFYCEQEMKTNHVFKLPPQEDEKGWRSVGTFIRSVKMSGLLFVPESNSIYIRIETTFGYYKSGGSYIDNSGCYHIVGEECGRNDRLYEDMVPYLKKYIREKRLQEIGI